MSDASLYKVSEDLVLDAAWFNRLLGDVNTRLRGVEAIEADLNEAVIQLQAVGLQRIDDVISPIIAQVRADVQDVADNLVAVAGQISDLLGGVLPAAYVSESASRVFVTPEQRALIGQLAVELDQKAAAADTILTGVTQLANAIRVTGVISPPSVNADVDNFAPVGLASAGRVRIVSNAPRHLSGLVAGEDGRQITLENLGSHDLTLKRESASSLATNRFAIPADLDIAAGGGTVTLLYDGALARWTVVSGGKNPSLAIGMRAQYEHDPGAPWLVNDGSTLLQSAYPDLFAAVGHKYVGDILGGASIITGGVKGTAGFANNKYWLISSVDVPVGAGHFTIWKSDTGLPGSWIKVGDFTSAYHDQLVGPVASDGVKTFALANNAYFQLLVWNNGAFVGDKTGIINGADVTLGKSIACIGGKYVVAVHAAGADARIAYADNPFEPWTVIDVAGKAGSITGMLHNAITGQIFTANGALVHYASDPAGPWASSALPTSCTAMCVLSNGIYLLSGPAGLFTCSSLTLADWTLVSASDDAKNLTDLAPTPNGYALSNTRRLVGNQFVIANGFSAYAATMGRAYCDGKCIIAPGGASTGPIRYPLALDMSTQFCLAKSTTTPPSYVKAK